MNFVCTRCGRKEAVTTRAAHCPCGGLWKLEADLPAFDLSGVDRTNGACSATGSSWRWRTRAGAPSPWARA